MVSHKGRPLSGILDFDEGSARAPGAGGVLQAQGQEERTPQQRLIDRIYQVITSTNEDIRLGLERIAEQVYGATRAQGAFTKRTLYEAQEAAVNRWLRENGPRLLAPTTDPNWALTEIRAVLEKLASQTVRSQEQIERQQFSTPPTIAWLVDKLAAAHPDDVVLEPSAGTGGLVALLADVVERVHVNEIDPERAALARQVLGVEPTQHDAEILHARLDPSVKPTVVVMNPPFTAPSINQSGQKRNSLKYGFAHVKSALQRLQPGGRLVAILAGGREGFQASEGASLTAPAARPYWHEILRQSVVRASVRIAGKEYQKYGTAMPVQVIVLDKTAPTPGVTYQDQVASAVTGDFDTVEEAYAALRSVAESRPESPQRGTDHRHWQYSVTCISRISASPGGGRRLAASWAGEGPGPGERGVLAPAAGQGH